MPFADFIDYVIKLLCVCTYFLRTLIVEIFDKEKRNIINSD